MIKGTAKINQGLPFSLFHKVRSRVHSRLREDCKIDRMHYPPVELKSMRYYQYRGFRSNRSPRHVMHRFQWHFKILLISVLIWPNKVLSFLEQKAPDLQL